MDGGAWWVIVHRGTNSRTRLKWLSAHTARVILSSGRYGMMGLLIWTSVLATSHFIIWRNSFSSYITNCYFSFIRFVYLRLQDIISNFFCFGPSFCLSFILPLFLIYVLFLILLPYFYFLVWSPKDQQLCLSQCLLTICSLHSVSTWQIIRNTC